MPQMTDLYRQEEGAPLCWGKAEGKNGQRRGGCAGPDTLLGGRGKCPELGGHLHTPSPRMDRGLPVDGAGGADQGFVTLGRATGLSLLRARPPGGPWVVCHHQGPPPP